MVRAATSTFGGLETANPYQAGLAFNRDHDEAIAQDERAWKVTANLVRRSGDIAELSVKLHDRNGNPITGVAVAATLAHPADARRDQSVALVGPDHRCVARRNGHVPLAQSCAVAVRLSDGSGR
jgi:nitrogen fixation protein FixH